MALTNKLTAIANAIREKTGDTATMTLDEMPMKIREIVTSGIDYAVNKDDVVSKIAINVYHDCSSLLSMLNRIDYEDIYSQTLADTKTKLRYKPLMGFSIVPNIYSIKVGRLTNIEDSNLIADIIFYYYGDLDGSFEILFASSPINLSFRGITIDVKSGWQMKLWDIKSRFGSDAIIDNFLKDFIPEKDNYFAKSQQAFGEFYNKSEVLENLQEKTMTLGENKPTVITPDSPYFGLSKVTPAIDSTTINRNNIKKNSYILGVHGDVAEFPSGAWYVFHTSESKVDEIGRTYYKIFEVLEGTFSNTSHACTYAMISNTLLSSWQSQFSELSGSMGLFYGEAGHSVGEYVDIDFAHFIT